MSHTIQEYEARVRELEEEGMSTSDAQGVADCEAMCDECREWFPLWDRWYLLNGTGVRFSQMTVEQREEVKRLRLRCELCEEEAHLYDNEP